MIEIIQNVLSDHYGIKLEIKNRRITRKSQNTWKTDNKLLNNPWLKEELIKEKKNLLNVIKIKIHHIKICGTPLKQCWEGNL